MSAIENEKLEVYNEQPKTVRTVWLSGFPFTTAKLDHNINYFKPAVVILMIIWVSYPAYGVYGLRQSQSP